MVNTLVLLSESAAHSSGPNHWAVGGGVLAGLLLLLLAVIAVGGGREHS